MILNTRKSLISEKVNMIFAVELKVKFLLGEGFKDLLQLLCLINDTRTSFSRNGNVKTNIARQTQLQHGAIDLKSKGDVIQIYSMCPNSE